MTGIVTERHAGLGPEGIRRIALALAASVVLLLAVVAAGRPSGIQGHSGGTIEAVAGGSAVTAGYFQKPVGHRIPGQG